MAEHVNSEKLIHSINLDGNVYEIHDAYAIHTLADLAALGIDTEGAFIFKGTVATVGDLPTTGNKIGYVYHVTENHSEYVWAKVDGGTTEGWEEFGEHFVINHTHNVTVTGTNKASSVSGTATVTGGNSTSNVSGTATITVPKVSESAKYVKVTNSKDTFVKSYPGTTSKMVTKSITPAGSATTVINSVTPTPGSVTGVSGSTTASKATAGTAVNVATVDTAVTVATRASSQTTVGNANVGDAIDVGTALSGASVVRTGGLTNDSPVRASVTNGVLTLDPMIVVASAVMPTLKTTSITPAAASETKIYAVGGTKSIVPAKANGTITPYTFADVTVPVADAEATELVASVSTGTASVATVGSAVTLATGALSSTGTGSSVMTGLGTATTASALISAGLAAGTSSDGIHTGDNVTIETQEVTGTISGTAAAQTWTQNTGTISGTAAAQVWTQKSGVTGNPIAE